MQYEEEHSECNLQLQGEKMLDIKMQNVETIQLFLKKKNKNHVMIVLKELLKMNPMGKLLMKKNTANQTWALALWGLMEFPQDLGDQFR